VLCRRRASRWIRTGQRGRRAQRLDQRILVDRIDEHAGLGSDELRRSADSRCDHRAPAGHRLERGLAEGLDQAGLADDVRRGDLRGNAVVRKATSEHDARPALELCAKRTVADERQGPLAKSFEGAGEAEHILPLDQ